MAESMPITSSPGFPQNNAVRAHTQRVVHQLTLRNFAHPFYIGRTRFHTQYMRLLQL